MRYLMTILMLMALAHANSIGPVFALQQAQGIAPSYANVTNVQLGLGTPLLQPTLVTHYLTGNYLAFVTSLLPTTGPMEVTLTIAGVTYATGAFVHEVDQCVNSFVLPRNLYKPVDGQLTITYAGEVMSYSFEFVDPVPEPATLALMGIGLLAIALVRVR